MAFNYDELYSGNKSEGKNIGRSGGEYDYSALYGGQAPDAPATEEAPKRTWLGTAGDALGTALKAGAGVGEAIVGLADIPTGGAVGKFLENEDGLIGFRPKQMRAIVDENLMSDAQRAAQKKVDKADGFVDTIKAVYDNPSTLATTVAESLPSMYLGGGIGAALGRVSKLGNLSRAAIGEGAVSAGQTAEQIRQQTADGRLTAGQSAIAAGSGALTGLLNVGGGALAKKLGIADVDQFVMGARSASPEVKAGIMRRVLGGAVSEGLLEELPQSAQEQIAQNWALDKPLDEGVGKAAALGLMSGAALGGAVNLRPGQDQTSPEDKPAHEDRSRDFVARAFTDVGGAGETVDQFNNAKALVAYTLKNRSDEEAKQIITHVANGNKELAQQLLAARNDEALTSAGEQFMRSNLDIGSAVRERLLFDSGLMETDESQSTNASIAQHISGRFPALFEYTPEQPADSGVQVPAQPQPQQVNSAGFTPEPVGQLQEQLQAVTDGRKPAAVVGLQEAQSLDMTGLSQGIATDPNTGEQAMVVARDDETVQAAVTRASEVGLKQAMGEVLGYAQPGLTTQPGAPAAAVQQIDDNTGSVISEEIVSPEAAGQVQRVPGTTPRVLPVPQAMFERAQAASQDATVDQQLSDQPTAVAPAEQAAQTLPTAVEPQNTAVVQPTRATQLVSRLNAMHSLQEGSASAISESSVKEVDLASIKDKGARRQLKQLTQAVKEAFGTDLILVDTPSGAIMRNDGTEFTRFNGVAIPDQRAVYLNVRAATPLNTAGHELTHVLEQSFPDLYEKLETTVINRARHSSIVKLKRGLQAAVDAESQGGADAQQHMAELRSELVAEGVGEMMQDPNLWGEVFGQIGNNQPAAKSLYDSVIGTIGKLAKAFTRVGYIEGLKDMQVVRKAVTDAFVGWSIKYEQQRAAEPVAAGAETAGVSRSGASEQAPAPAAPAKTRSEPINYKPRIKGKKIGFVGPDGKVLFSRDDNQAELVKRITNKDGPMPSMREIASDPLVHRLYTALEARRIQADKLKPKFDEIILEIAALTGMEPKLANVKGMPRAFEKAWFDYGGNAGNEGAALRIKDLNRATVQFRSVDDIPAVIEAVKKRFPGASVKRNGYAPGATTDDTGYRDVFFNVEFQGVAVELQANHPEMLQAKDKFHKDYELTRSMDAQMPDGFESMTKTSNASEWLQGRERKAYLEAKLRQRVQYSAAYFRILDESPLNLASNSALVNGMEPSSLGNEVRTVRPPGTSQMKQTNSEQATGNPSESQNQEQQASASSTSSGVITASSVNTQVDGTNQDSVRPDGLVQFSRQNILAVANGNRVAPMAVLDAPTEAMVKSGLNRRLPIRMEASVIDKLLTGKDYVRRQLSPDEILNLRDRIQAPIAVFDDPTEKNSVVLMTDFLVDGDPVVVAISKTPIEKTYNVDSVDQLGRKIQGGTTEKAKFSPFKTAYGKDLTGLLSWLNKSKMTYFNPALSKSSLDLFLHNRLEEAATKGRAYKEKTAGPLGNTTSDSALIASTSSSGVESQTQPSKGNVALPTSSVNPAPKRPILSLKKTAPMMQRVFDDKEALDELTEPDTQQPATYPFKEMKDGSILIKGDAEEIRSIMPAGLVGKATPEGLVVSPSMAPRAKAALSGDEMLYGRAGVVQQHSRYQSGDRKGQYIGAPEKYNSPAKIGGLRKLLKQLALEGVAGRFWYEESGKAVLQYVGGDANEARKFISLLAIYSPQAKVNANTTMALSAWEQYRAGRRIDTKTDRQDRQAEDVLYNNKPWGGEKTNNFYKNLMREVDIAIGGASMQGATIDMWMMRAAEYSTDAPTPAQYKFVEVETNRLAKELGWEPQQVQAAIWTAIKARTENKGVKAATEEESQARGFMHYETGDKGKPVRKIDNGPEHRKIWFRNAMAHTLSDGDIGAAAYHFGTALGERSANVSWEATPGVSTGVLPGIHAAPIEQQESYLNDVIASLRDESGADLIDKEIGNLVARGMKGYSGWKGEASVGVQQAAPVYRQGKNPVSDISRTLLELNMAIRGLVLAQEGMAWHMPTYGTAKYGQNGIEFDIGRKLSYEETAVLYADISAELGNTEAPPIPTAQGFRVLNFPEEKFALMDDKLSDAERKGLQKSQRQKNNAFHAAVVRAVERQAWAAEVRDQPTVFETDGNLITNNWESGDADYRRAIQEKQRALEEAGFTRSWAGRPDIFEWIDRDLRPRVNRVNEAYAEKYGWGAPVRFSRPGLARLAEPAGGPSAGSDQGDAVSVAGAVHYGQSGFLSQLTGSAFGSGIRGAEQQRLSEPGVDPRIKKRVYFYLPAEGGIPQPEIGLGSHVYEADLSNLYDPSEGSRKFPVDANAFESAVLDAGYRGYINREQGTAVVLNENVPVQYRGTRDGKVVVPRRIQRIAPKVATRTEGDESVRKVDQIVSLKAKEAAKAAAPSFRMEYGEARVKTDEKDAANAALEEAGSQLKFSRPLKEMSYSDLLATVQSGRPNYTLLDAISRNQWADAYQLAGDQSQRQQLLSKLGDWVIQTFADSMIPVKRWIDSLPLSPTLKQKMTGDLYRAATLRSAMQKEVKDKFTEPMFRAIEAAAKKTGLSSDVVKQQAGYWMTAKYAPKANAWLITKDRAALIAAQQSGDAAAIARAQQNLNDRIDDVTGVPGAARKRGVAGGFNDAEAATLVKEIESKISRQLLDSIASPMYDMMAWRKAKDIQSGRVSQTAVNSWPNHRDYVPLTGDPRYTPDSADVFSTGGQINQEADKALNGRKESISDDGIEAAFTAVIKSINSSAIQSFKRSLAKAHSDAQAAGIDIGVKREPVTGIIRNGDDVVIYRDTVTAPNGLQRSEAYAYRFDDPKVIQALKKENEESVNAILKVISSPTRWYGRLVTQFMPMFAPVNFVRDVWERSELVRTRKLLDRNGNVIDTDKLARSAIAESINPALWKASLDSNFDRARQSQERDDLEEMIRLGGSSTYGDYLARNSADLEDGLRQSFGKLAAAGRFTNKNVEAYNNTFEVIPSLALYRSMKANGMTAEDAAAATLDLMNFKKRGTAMPAIRALYVFSQPAATSGYNLAQYLSTSKGRNRFAAQALIGTALYAFLSSLWGGGDDDEDKELGNKLDNISNSTIERSIPIPIGGMMVKVPVGFGPPQLAWAAAGIFNRWMSGRYDTPAALGELAKGWAKSVSPISPSDIEISKRPVDWLMMTMTPTIARPLMSIGSDQTAFGQPLTPINKDPLKYRSDQARRTTPMFYTEIATDIREMTGVDVYPDHIKALMDGYLVGPVREITKVAIDNPAKEMRGEPASVSVISSVLDNVNDRAILNSIYFRVRTEIEDVDREYENRLRSGTLSEWMDADKLQQVQAYKRMRKAEDVFANMRGVLTKQRDRMDPEVLAARTQDIEERVDRARKEALTRYFRSHTPAN